jgi:hypothetical protein
MGEIRYHEMPTGKPPREGLPAEFLFAPRRPLDRGAPAGVDEVLAWCAENLGPGIEIGLFDDRPLGPGEPWGYWPGGAVFIRELHVAMWFKMVWC